MSIKHVLRRSEMVGLGTSSASVMVFEAMVFGVAFKWVKVR